jgi:serine protease Do
LLCAAIALAAAASAETVKDREGSVRNDRATMEKDTRWIYNDWQQGLAEGKRRGMPVLVVLRCIPCLACAGIDAKVLDRETEIAPLLDQFVCVRVINANALDLSLFQFDYDLSFSTLFLNGDGTVYGRYGSWRQQKDPQDKTTAGYRRALEGALALHKGYPGNKGSLAAKQGKPMPYKTPVEMPTIAGKYTSNLDWAGKVVGSCVHCHQIGDALRTAAREKHQPIPTSLIYPWPAPETIGLALAPDQMARVESVAPGSVAARAGLQAGDDIASLGGQPLISVADASWALHHAPDAGTLAGEARRGVASTPFTLELPADWRFKSDIGRRVGTWEMRRMASGGILAEDLDDEARRARSIDPKAMALLVKHVGEYGSHAAAKKAGFRKDDVLVAVDGLTNRMSEGELIGRLLQKHQPDAKVSATVLRGSERLNLSLPMQ